MEIPAGPKYRPTGTESQNRSAAKGSTGKA
jgi:hypothetical protein